MNVEQMSAADLLREGKQAMALAMGSVGPDTRARWNAVMAEIDLRLSVGDLDEDDLDGRLAAAAESVQIAEAEKRAALAALAEAVASRTRAEAKVTTNADNLQFVQDAFNANHPALDGQWGADLSHGAKLLWEWVSKASTKDAEVVIDTAEKGAEEGTEVKRGNWTTDDKIHLLMMVKPGFTLAGAAAEMNRTVGGIKYQLDKLGLTQPMRLTNGVVFGDVAWREKWFGSRVDLVVMDFLRAEGLGMLVKNNAWKPADRGYILPLRGRVE